MCPCSTKGRASLVIESEAEDEGGRGGGGRSVLFLEHSHGFTLKHCLQHDIILCSKENSHKSM